MEKLEKKIEQIVNKSFKGEYGNSELDEKECSTSIAQEVKDITIAFALHLSEYAPTKNPQLLDDIFTNFINTYYK